MTLDTRSRMLASTARLIQEKGFHGVGLKEILADSEAPRGSLYFHFPGGKEQLVLEAMLEDVERTTALLRETLDHAEDPAVGVRRFIEAAADAVRDSNYTFGCPVAPTVLDAPPATSQLADACRDSFDGWRGMYRDAFEAAGMDAGQAGSLATLTLAALEGALLMAKASRDTGPLLTVSRELEAAIRRALPA